MATTKHLLSEPKLRLSPLYAAVASRFSLAYISGVFKNASHFDKGKGSKPFGLILGNFAHVATTRNTANTALARL